MADYNVNMKQWNGSSFDNVLPLAFNSKALEGKSYDDIIQYAKSRDLLLYTGQYTGTGTSSSSNPISITFPFEPILFSLPCGIYNPNTAKYQYSTLNLTFVDSTPSLFRVLGDGGATTAFYIYKSADGKTINMYSSPFDTPSVIYSYAAIGGYDMGGVNEWAITSSGTWTVPKTGKYVLELYGRGGNGHSGLTPLASGGASCQRYDSINLIKGDKVSVSIGSTSVSSTSFGTYSVANAGRASQGVAGIGTGNRGANGKVRVGSEIVSNTFGSGVLSSKYGYGGAAGSIDLGDTGGPGAVYLKYLGE